MSYVIAAPEMMTSAAADLATIGSNVNAAHMVAATRTTAVLPAAADEVSASIAHLFSEHAASYQALAGQAAAFNDQFVQHLTASAGAFAHAEAANVALLQPLQGQLLNLLTGFQNMLTSSLTSLLTPLFPVVTIFAFLGFILLIEFAIFIYFLPQFLAFIPQLLLADLPPLLASFGI